MSNSGVSCTYEQTTPASRPSPRERVEPPGAMERECGFEREAVPQMRMLFHIAYALTRNAADAEDLVQETMLRAYRGFHSYQPGTNVRAWLRTILSRARTDALRRTFRTPRTVPLGCQDTGVPPEQDHLAGGAETIAAALARLPERFRQAIVLRDVKDLSYRDVSRALGVPMGTVMSRIHRGRALLRADLVALAPRPARTGTS